MKKTFFIATILLLSACTTNLHDLLFGEYILKEIINQECTKTPDGLYVIQVLDDGVLAKTVSYYRIDYETVDKTRFNRPDYDDPIIYIPVSKEQLKDKFDDSASSIHENACLKADGTYSYKTALGAKRTIQKFKIIQPKYIPNPEYEKAQK